MNKYTFFLLLFLSGSSRAQLTLNEAINIGINESHQGKNIALNQKITDYKIAAFQSSLGWQMTVNGQVPAYAKSNLSTVQNDGNIAFQPVNYNNSALGISLSKTIWQTGGEFQISSGLQRFDNFQSKHHLYNGIPIRLTFRQNITGYNAYKWKTKNNRLKKEINRRQSKIDKMLLRINITNSFFDVLLAQNNISSNQSNLELTQNLMNIAQAKDSLGLISKKQFLQLKLQLKTAQSQLNIAQTNLQIARQDLESRLSNRIKIDQNLTIPSPPNTTLDIDSMIHFAQANRPEWLELRRRIQEKSEKVKALSRQYGPAIKLNASLGLIRSDPELAPVYQDAQQDQSIGISFHIPIFDSHLKRNKILAAQTELMQQKNESQQSILELENEITKLAREFQACQTRLAYAKEIRDMATQNLQITTKTFKLGLTNIAELNLAIQEKNRAYQNYIFEIRRYWLLYFELIIESPQG